MAMEGSAPKDIDEYIAGFPLEVQVILEKIRKTIREAAPEAVETIKYKMPSFVLKGNRVHFAAYKRHISIYPAPRGSESFNQKLAAYLLAKSTLRFSLDEPIPYELISEIVKLRIKENLEKAEARGGKNAAK